MSGDPSPSLLVNGPTPLATSVKRSGARDELGGWAMIEPGWLRTAPAANPRKSRRFKPDTEPTLTETEQRFLCKGLHNMLSGGGATISPERNGAAFTERAVFEDWRLVPRDDQLRGTSCKGNTCRRAMVCPESYYCPPFLDDDLHVCGPSTCRRLCFGQCTVACGVPTGICG